MRSVAAQTDNTLMGIACAYTRGPRKLVCLPVILLHPTVQGITALTQDTDKVYVRA